MVRHSRRQRYRDEIPTKSVPWNYGCCSDTSEKVSTVPPINVGGNLDINELGVGATLYLPVE